MSTKARLGPVLRGLRKRNDWTLSEVARRTGLSISTLSKAERNQQTLSYDKLVQLSEGLNVDIGVFFEGESAANGHAISSTRRSINRVGDGTVMDTANFDYCYLSTDLLRKKFLPILVEVRARSLEEFGEMVRHDGEEYAYVLEGTVEVHTEAYTPAVLKAGESIYFDSRMAHAYVVRGRGRCRLLSICSAPEASLQQALSEHVGAKPGTKGKR